MDLRGRDRRSLARESAAEDFQIARSNGAFCFDAHGRKYVDFLSGWCVGNLGWGNRVIRAAIRAHRGPDYVFPDFLYRPWVELAELLTSLTPGRLRKCFRATGGTEAVEIALQAAMAATKRSKFVSIEGSYHGDSIGTMSIGSSGYREQYPGLLSRCRKISPPLDEGRLDRVETLLKKRDVAAFVMEPVILNLGVVIPENAFMTGLQRLCRRYGTLLVFDEVATGFGRTGTLFGSEHFGVEPDLLCLGKAITGGYAGMGATVANARAASALDEDSSYYSTYGWHPLAAAAAIANLRHFRDHRRDLLEHVARTSEYFRARLTRMRFRRPAEIRVLGLAIAIEFEDPSGRYTGRVARKCLEERLLLSSQGDDTLTLFPPLTISREVARRGLDALERSL